MRVQSPALPGGPAGGGGGVGQRHTSKPTACIITANTEGFWDTFGEISGHKLLEDN